jgi:hypothetical protein
MPVFIILGLEERIAQRHCFDTLHIDIPRKLRVNVKENRHVHCFPRIQPLLLEAKALDLAKIRRNLTRRYGIGSDADDVLVRSVRCRVEGERCLARQNTHFALLWHEFPVQHIGHRAVECYAYTRVRSYGTEALGGIDGGIAVRCGFDGLAAPASGLANLGWRK